jgi:hypothetical protein
MDADRITQMGCDRFGSSLKGANIGGTSPRGVGWEDRRHGLLFPLPRSSDSAWLLVRSHGLHVKDIELLVLRHELEILRRQSGTAAARRS